MSFLSCTFGFQDTAIYKYCAAYRCFMEIFEELCVFSIRFETETVFQWKWCSCTRNKEQAEEKQFLVSIMAGSFKPFKKWLEESPQLFQALQTKWSCSICTVYDMTRTEIHHLSLKVSFCRLMPLKFILPLLCSTKGHKSCSDSENGPQRRTSKCQTLSKCLFEFCFPPKLNIVSSSSI